MKTPFYLYINKGRKNRIANHIFSGILIRESGAGIESRMSRALDSESIDIEGDINYFLNCLSEDSVYGNCSTVAIIPKKI